MHAGTIITPPVRVALTDQFGTRYTTEEKLLGLAIEVTGSDFVVSPTQDVTIGTSGRDFPGLTLLKLDSSAALVGCRTNKTLSFVRTFSAEHILYLSHFGMRLSIATAAKFVLPCLCAYVCATLFASKRLCYLVCE